VIAIGPQYGIRMQFAQFGNEESQSILNELESRGLIEPLNRKKSEYRITAKGIQIAALLGEA
jgi:predicted transcriptional regulator